MARDSFGQLGELTNELPASLSGVAGGIDGSLQGVGLHRQVVVHADTPVRSTSATQDARASRACAAARASLGGAALGPADRFGRQAPGRVERGTSRRGADEVRETAVGLGELRPPRSRCVGAAGQDGQIGVDGRDPLLPVGGPGGRA